MCWLSVYGVDVCCVRILPPWTLTCHLMYQMSSSMLGQVFFFVSHILCVVSAFMECMPNFVSCVCPLLIFAQNMQFESGKADLYKQLDDLYLSVPSQLPP